MKKPSTDSEQCYCLVSAKCNHRSRLTVLFAITVEVSLVFAEIKTP